MRLLAAADIDEGSRRRRRIEGTTQGTTLEVSRQEIRRDPTPGAHSLGWRLNQPHSFGEQILQPQTPPLLDPKWGLVFRRLPGSVSACRLSAHLRNPVA